MDSFLLSLSISQQIFSLFINLFLLYGHAISQWVELFLFFSVFSQYLISCQACQRNSAPPMHLLPSKMGALINFSLRAVHQDLFLSINRWDSQQALELKHRQYISTYCDLQCMTPHLGFILLKMEFFCEKFNILALRVPRYQLYDYRYLLFQLMGPYTPNFQAPSFGQSWFLQQIQNLSLL